jgi:hypothetical protein
MKFMYTVTVAGHLMELMQASKLQPSFQVIGLTMNV